MKKRQRLTRRQTKKTYGIALRYVPASPERMAALAKLSEKTPPVAEEKN